jgi:small subunit ribosomal protein S8
MSMTDPIADMLTRIRNGSQVGTKSVATQYSNVKKNILRVLKEQGYIVDYQPKLEGAKGVLAIELKYGPDGEKLFRHMQRVSRPGRRVYRGSSDLEPVLNGMGIFIVSTPKGVMSDLEARRKGVGGEVICEIW